MLWRVFGSASLVLMSCVACSSEPLSVGVGGSDAGMSAAEGGGGGATASSEGGAGGDAQVDPCPTHQREVASTLVGKPCSVEFTICDLGVGECCCGSCSWSFRLKCQNGLWRYIFSDFCLSPRC